MTELNTSIFYKVKFNICALNETDDLLWKVIYHIKNWLTRKYNKEKEFLSANNLW